MAKAEIIYRDVNDISLLEGNPRTITGKQFERLKESLDKNPDYFEARPIILSDRTGELVAIAGNQRLKAARSLGLQQVPTVLLSGLTEEREREIIIRDNVENGEWDMDALANEWDVEELHDWGVNVSKFNNDPNKIGLLVADFLAPPVSVIDLRQGYMADRKRELNGMLSLDSKAGRKEGLMKGLGGLAEALDGNTSITGTSEFNPALCELLVRWFSPEGGKVLDSFAGGSVRGVVSAFCGRDYTGIDISSEQIKANEDCRIRNKWWLDESNNKIEWICADSSNISKILSGQHFDFGLICPPYFDLEIYSDTEGDISNMSWEDFSAQYRKILIDSANLLKDNRFYAVVISDVRDRKGYYRDLRGLTTEAMREAGFRVYNEMVVVDPAQNAHLRARRYMNARKVVRTHQEALVFYKGDDPIKAAHQNMFIYYNGDPKKIREEFGMVGIDRRKLKEFLAVREETTMEVGDE